MRSTCWRGWGTRPCLGTPGRLGEQSYPETTACFEETKSQAEPEGTVQAPPTPLSGGRSWGNSATSPRVTRTKAKDFSYIARQTQESSTSSTS